MLVDLGKTTRKGVNHVVDLVIAISLRCEHDAIIVSRPVGIAIIGALVTSRQAPLARTIGIDDHQATAAPLASPVNQTAAIRRPGCLFAIHQHPLVGAIRNWYSRRFGVEVSEDDVVPLPGSKGGLSRANLALADPGDLVILPDPAFPSYVSSAQVAGLEVHRLELRPELGWHPDLSAIPADVAERARFIILNYPNNPTGAATTREFLAELVEWGSRTRTLVIFDNAYQFIAFDGREPLSILSIPGAAGVAVEFHTLSKAYGMAGVRIAFAAGHPVAVAALKKIEVYYQAGIFAPSLAAATGLFFLAKQTVEYHPVYQQRISEQEQRIEESKRKSAHDDERYTENGQKG